MQFEIKLSVQNGKCLEFNYQHHLSAALYSILGKHYPALAQDLHDGTSKSMLKMFVFSCINSLPKPVCCTEGNFSGMRLGSKIWMRFSSIIPEIAYAMAESLQKEKEIRIGAVVLSVQNISLVPPMDFAPATVYRPFGQAGMIICKQYKDGKNYFQYPDNPTPEIARCGTLIAENLRHKLLRLKDIRNDLFENILSASNLTEEKLRQQPVEIQFLPLNADRLYRTGCFTIKNSVVHAFRAPFRMTDPEPFHRILWECGAGNLNSQGFGFVMLGKQE